MGGRRDMSATVDSDSGGNKSAFNSYMIAALIASGMIAFIAFWVLSAFAPQLGTGRDGGAHALSRSATSYSAIVELLRANGARVEINRDEEADEGLLILTPSASATADDIWERIDAHGDQPLLIVLPRWQTRPVPEQRGWVHRGPPVGPPPFLSDHRFNLAARYVTTRGGAIGYGVVLPDQVQVMQSANIRDVISAPDGGIVVGSLANRPQVMLLADADLIANHGVATPRQAASAVALLEELAPDTPVFFDVVLNGYGASRSLLRLAFTPPFLGLTLCLLAAGLFALWSGFGRFGPPWRENRVVPFGKAGLVANSARLIVQAQRVTHFARTYVGQVREAAARRLHAPTGLSGAALDAWLDRFPDRKGGHFSRLAGDLTAATTTVEAVARARALGQWRKDILRDSQ
jgi:hypothetical protein